MEPGPSEKQLTKEDLETEPTNDPFLFSVYQKNRPKGPDELFFVHFTLINRY